MKSKTIHTIIGAIVFIVIVVVWKLNSYYKQERSAFVEGQIHQQTITLKTSISSQITQLKNIISSYQGQIDESKINWVQLTPFFGLAQMEINGQGSYVVKNLFVKSGTPAEAWSKDYLQKAFAYSPFSNKEIHGQLFQNQIGDKFLSLIFSDQKIQNTRRAVALVGDASYFQKYFDTVRSSKSTNLLMTTDNVVVGHTQSDYIATKSQESKLNPNKYFVDRDELRSTNLFVMSYAGKAAANELIFIPPFVLTFVFGLAFLLIGILLYTLKPIENEQRKADIFKKVFDEVQKKPPETQTFVTREPLPDLNKPAQNFDLNKFPSTPEFSVEEVLAEESLQEKVEREVMQVIPQSEPVLNLIGKKLMAMGDVVDMALVAISSQVAARGVNVHKFYESTKAYEFDVDRFRKAIENILVNAIEAGAKNITIQVYEDLGEADEPVNIDIIDDGQGIEPGTSEKIWQPFFGTKDRLKHKGLGLSEALSVVRRYGADVRIIDNPGTNGATIRIEMDSELRRPRTIFSKQPAVAQPESTHMSSDTVEIDIDSILNLDDEVTETLPQKIDLAEEYSTTQFKMDEKVSVVAHPDIKVEKSVKPIDDFSVKVRKPGRT